MVSGFKVSGFKVSGFWFQGFRLRVATLGYSNNINLEYEPLTGNLETRNPFLPETLFKR